MQIRDLCDATTVIPRDRRRGYGNTMSNIVFYHSVPNNIPGMLFCQNKSWNALFPHRMVPEWLPRILDGPAERTQVKTTATRIPENLINLLLLIKKGRRTDIALSRGLGFDPSIVHELLAQAKSAGFINENNRLSAIGSQAIWVNTRKVEGAAFDMALYIPTKWCAGRETVQPSGLGGETRWEKTESTSGSPRVDGGVGQTPLERTDAKTTASSLRVAPQGPSLSRKRSNPHGPLGSKEK